MHSNTHTVQQTGEKTYRSVDELAKDIGIGRSAAYAALRSGDIPSIRLGKRFIIPRAAIQDWLRSAAGRQAVA